MSHNFIKNVEDFTCEHCGRVVEGDGYTNHCPACLWSKHVDVHPGDRAARCGGLMRPASFCVVEGGYDITHQCEHCGHSKPNRAAPGDNLDALASL